MASVLLGLTPEEALAGVTRNAARALGLLDRGTLEVGKRADLALWSVSHPAELSYWMGANPLRLVFKDGVARTPEEAARALESAPGSAL
jgi:imidazolonepropionase